MKFKGRLLGSAILVLAGCAQTPESDRAKLISDIRALECAIGYSAIDQMRANSRLPDPYMVQDCPFDRSTPQFDLAPALDGSAANTPSGALLKRRLSDRRFPDRMIADIVKSAPFARAEKLVSQLNPR